MKRAEDDYKDQGLKVIWIGFQDKLEKIMEFMEKHDIDSSVGYDKRNMISTQYGIAYGAGLIAIDKEGTVVQRIPKGFSGEGLSEALAKAFSGEEAASAQ